MRHSTREHHVLTAERRVRRVDPIFEGDPSLLEFLSSPLIQFSVDEVSPSDFVFRVNV